MQVITLWPKYRYLRQLVERFFIHYLNFPSLRRCENISPPGTNSRTIYKLLLSWKFGIFTHKKLDFRTFAVTFWEIFYHVCRNISSVLTLKWYSKLTKNGKLIACKILFSLRVCSTCFNFTTWKMRRIVNVFWVFQ